jgi:hypothetical protein
MSNKGLTERVLIECGRSKGIDKYHHRLIEEWDGTFVPNRISKHVFNESGDPLDNLSPLYRWLDSHVGLPWSEVYSEITKKLKPNTQSGQHVLGHLFSEVNFHCIFFDDDPTPYRPEHDRVSYRQKKLNPGEYYLDLEGILKKTPTFKHGPKQSKLIKVGDQKFVYLINGRGWVGENFVDARTRYIKESTGWYVEAVREEIKYKYQLQLDTEDRPIFISSEIIKPDGTVEKIYKPKLNSSQQVVKRLIYYKCDKDDLIKLKNHGIDVKI